MNLSWIDWVIMAVVVVAIRYVSLSTRRYMKGVTDFLSANRLAGRYLLTIASGMGGVGVITFIGSFEMLYSRGLSPNWWAMMTIPCGTIILLTGWVYYRFRETRALTMAQFFEMRYTRRFRIYAGFICWFSGIINFGIFPAVAANFFVHFCGLPAFYHIPGVPFHLSTFITVMAVDLALTLSFVTMGGQVSVMVTECAQGIFCAMAFFVVSVAVLVQIKWPQMVAALKMAPSNASMINPFHTSGVGDFNIWYFLIGFVGSFYYYMSWQGTSGFNSSARTPHEQKMGGIIGVWRQVPQTLMGTLLPLAALAVMKLPEFSAKAAVINETLKHIPIASVRGEMQVPVAMANILPMGIKGLFATAMLCFSFTCHDTYLHSWGSIFIQDVYMPLRKKAISPEQHIRLLRLSIFGVAAFAFLFSVFYKPTQYIFMFFAITGAIWTCGSGAAIIGGLYWKRGTSAGAYSGITVGAILGVGGLIARPVYQSLHGHDLPINDAWLSFIGMVCAAGTYVVVSLLTSRKPFDLDKMLHRGQYSDAVSHHVEHALRSRWQQVVGITSEFSLSDKILATTLVAWNGLNWLFFLIFSAINLIFHIGDSIWAKWWHFNILWNLVLSVPAIVWFTVGGVIDIKALFKTLATAERDASDNGTVMRAEGTYTNPGEGERKQNQTIIKDPSVQEEAQKI